MKPILVKLTCLSLAGLTAFVVSGCADTLEAYDYSRMAPPAAAVGAGGIAYLATKDNMSETNSLLITGGAAAGGFIVAEILREQAETERKETFKAGYEVGVSYTTKELDNIRERIESWKNPSSTITRIYAFPGTMTGKKGEQLVIPYEVNLPVDEPR